MASIGQSAQLRWSERPPQHRLSRRRLTLEAEQTCSPLLQLDARVRARGHEPGDEAAQMRLVTDHPDRILISCPVRRDAAPQPRREILKRPLRTERLDD